MLVQLVEIEGVNSGQFVRRPAKMAAALTVEQEQVSNTY